MPIAQEQNRLLGQLGRFSGQNVGAYNARLAYTTAVQYHRHYGVCKTQNKAWNNHISRDKKASLIKDYIPATIYN